MCLGVTDAGIVIDAGIVTDAGIATDAGIVTDAGVATDAGIARGVLTRPAAGVEPLAPALNRGCGCGATGAEGFGLLLLVALRRRR
jgi:uncharacterized protein (TIGR03382 family)